jgi:hypothetical protein
MIINSSIPFDLEWIPFEGEYSHDKTRITSAAFCTNRGKRIVLHISRFKQYPNPERKLIKHIIDNLNRFNITFGLYSTGVRKFNKKTGQVCKVERRLGKTEQRGDVPQAHISAGQSRIISKVRCVDHCVNHDIWSLS